MLTKQRKNELSHRSHARRWLADNIPDEMLDSLAKLLERELATIIDSNSEEYKQKTEVILVIKTAISRVERMRAAA